MISHLMSGLGFSPNFHTCAARVVALLFVSCLKLKVWLSYLVLKGVSVKPIYSEASADFRVALYMTDCVRHLPSTGQFAGTLQLQVLSLFGALGLSARILLLCLEMT